MFDANPTAVKACLTANVQFTSDASIFFQVQCQVLAFRVVSNLFFFFKLSLLCLNKGLYDKNVYIFLDLFTECKNQEEIQKFFVL